MSKKVKAYELPPNEKNLFKILQSRIAHRSRYITSAEAVLKEQRTIARMLMQSHKATGAEVPEELRNQIKSVLTNIRTDIRELARQQKIERVMLRTFSCFSDII